VSESVTSNVPLSAAISEVRRELVRAIEEGTDSPVAFRAGPVELEFSVEFETTAGGEAGVKVWVVSVGGKAERTRSETNRLKVTLTPVNRQGGDQLIGSVAPK
jgi:hypothetical protein